MKHVRCSSVDRLSELPSKITEIILMFLPLRDAMRTSILSRKWRFQWATVPQIVFDDKLTFGLPKRPGDILRKIYEILLLHQGPILKFTLDMYSFRSCSEIDKIIIFLSRNGIQELTLSLWDDKEIFGPKLPSYIFSCQELRHLSLTYIGFKPPPTFTGFSKLISLELHNVYLDPYLSISCFPLLERLTLESLINIDMLIIDAPNLKTFYFKGTILYTSFINTPLLAALSLSGDHDPYAGDSTFDLIKLLSSLPLIENLCMFYTFLKLLVVGKLGIAPNKLPTVLNNLRILELDSITFTETDQLSSVLCLIRSSPNLQKNKFKHCTHIAWEPELHLKIEDYSDYSLMKLQEVEIELDTFWPDMKPDLEFVKFLLAISPELETIRIKPECDTVDNCYRMLQELARYRRASPKAEVIFLDPYY